MKVVILLSLVAVVAAQLARDDLLIQRTEVRDDAGQVSLSYVTKDGTQVSEQGFLQPNDARDGFVLYKKGSYRFFSPDGVSHKVDYTADDKGFHPKSDDIPVQGAVPLPTF